MAQNLPVFVSFPKSTVEKEAGNALASNWQQPHSRNGH